MGDSTHVAILNEGIKAWNLWRRTNDSVVPDLSGANLEQADLVGANFRSVNLRGANLRQGRLRESDFARACLAGADFTLADLYQVEFYGADLRHAKLTGSLLSGAKFHNSNLNGADLSAADLYRVDFIGTLLEEADFSDARCRLTTFAGLDLSSTKGLSRIIHKGPSNVDTSTLQRSATLMPADFFIAAGVPEALVTFAQGLAPSPDDFYSCFISYSHRDKGFAQQLYSALRRRGVSCWLDEKQLRPGDDIYQEVDRGIWMWDKVLLCCSEASLSSWWVDNEIAIALEKEQHLKKERGDHVLAIVPLNLDGHLFSDKWTRGYRSQLRKRLALDFTDWKPNEGISEAQLATLILTLRANRQIRELPPPAKL